MSAMAAEKRKQVKRVVLAEVAGLLALLRRNEKFSTATTSSGHKRGAAAALVVSLEKLRDKARGWKSDQPLYPNPLDVMHPFFQVVRSAEASGPFTGAALKSLTCLLRMGLLELDGAYVSAGEVPAHTYTPVCGGGLQTDTQEFAGREDAQGAREGLGDHGRPRENGNGPLNGGEDKHAQAEVKALRNYREQRAEAVCELLDAVIHSRFEETDSQLDEVVKMRIIQLLAETVESPAGRLLSDEAVWEVVQTCLVNRNEVAHSKMLCHAAEQALFRIVRVVFTQLTLASFSTPAPQPADTQQQQQHDGSSTAAAGAAGSDTSPATPPRPRTLSEAHTHTHTPTHTHHNKPLKKGAHAHRGSSGYGLPCAVKIFGFLCSQLLQGFNLPMSSSMAGHPYHASLRVVCLRMIREALETAGPSLSSCPPLLALVRDDLCLAIIKTSRGGHSLEVLCEALGVIRCLWATLRRFLKMQFEAIFKSVFLRVLAQVKQAYTVVEADDSQSSEASKKNDYTPSEQQVILETLCDLLADPSLLADLFANYDCDIQRYDLLESLTRALADCAKAIDPEVVMSHAQGTPVVGVLPSSGGPPEHALVLRGLCMDALLQMLRQLYMRCDLPAAPPSARRHRTHTSSSSSTSSLIDHLGLSRSNGEESSSSASSSVPQAPARPPPASPTPTVPRVTLSETMQRKKWKRILQRGAEQFNQKPRLGLSYLVSEGVIPELTPAAVAKFLRTAPGLDYEAIGGYLGECGHPEVNPDTGKANYRADTRDFHKETLKEFVNTFHFQGQPMIAALRMFLATFRLPGEAQQIDRILQAFANVVFESCAEAQSGLLASADVAYLLAFSIIMLNTDLHNPNIRPEKRMTVSDFCKNNRNYGNDISQGKDLPPEFLETIYKSISEHPILSYDDSPEGEMTADRWRDLVRQAETDDEFGYMVVHDGNGVRTESGDQAVPRSSSNKEGSTVEDEETASSAANGVQPPIAASCGVYDKEMVQWLWRPFLAVAVKSFVGYDRDPEPPGGQQAGGAYTTAFLRQSVDMMLLIAKVTASHGLQEVFDTLLYLLCGFTGLLSDPPLRATADMPWDMQDDELEEAMADAHGLGAGDTSQAVLAGKALMGSAGQSLRVRDKLLGRLLYRFVHSPAAQMALVSVFGIAHRLADSIKSGWRPVLLLIFRLRDMKVLSKEVLRESDGDLLSPEGREAFMEALRERVLRGPSPDTDGNASTRTHAHTRPKTYHKTSSGGSRFLGGFVSYLFSSSASPAEDREALLSDSPDLEAWDFGLPSTHAHTHTHTPSCAATVNGNGVCVSSGSSHTHTDGSGGGGSGSGGSTQQQHSEDGDIVIIDSQGSEQKDAHRRGSKAAVTPPTPTVASVTAHTASPHTSALPGGVVYVKSLGHCRAIVKDIVANCKVAELVTDSRYVRLESLGHMVRALVGVIHTHTAGGDTEGVGQTHTQTGGGGGGVATEDGAAAIAPSQHEEAVISAALSDEYIARIRREIQLPGISPASVAFAEVLLVEVALRNRDRVSALWPKVLSEHYRVRLAHVAKTGKVTLATEKVVHGLLRLCVRLFSRDGLSDPLLESLTWMVPPSMPSDVTRLFAPLIGAGVWRMLTSNLSSLPGLSLRGWKAIFDAIEACAPCGGEATARAFEGLCFLLHEPQLKACVPVTCSSAVLAFITCPSNQEPLCRAALDLLMLLHARLDVMLRSQSAYANEAWPRCWSAILEALATAAKDMRLGVRCHALYLLSEALLDQQSRHVGATHLHRLLADVVIPLAQLVHTTSTDPLPPTHTHSDGAHTQQRRGSVSSSVSGRAGATQAKPPPPSSAASADNVVGGNAMRNGHATGVSDQLAAPGTSGGETGRPPERSITLTPSAFKAKELALSMVTSAFLVHLKDMLPLPTFHELWLKVLVVMEAYLGAAETQTSTNATTGASGASVNGRGGSKGAKATDPAAAPERPDDPLSELALEKLKNMLLVMSASGAFEPGEDTIGKELWELTWAVIGNFKACPDLREDLFGTHAPPTPAVVVASSSSMPSVSAVDGPTNAAHTSSTPPPPHDAGAATSVQEGAQLQQASLTDSAASNSDRSNSGGGDVSGSDAPIDTRNEPSKNDGGHGKGSMSAGAVDKGNTAAVMAPGAIVTA